MSMDRCTVCEVLVDTDYDCQAYDLIYDVDENNESGEIEANACHCENHRYFTTKEKAETHNAYI